MDGHDRLGRAAPAWVDRAVAVGLRTLQLAGNLTVPGGSSGVVLLVPDPSHAASGARDRQVASDLADAGLATLRVDLLSPDERDRRDHDDEPDVDLLAVRVLAITRWLRAHPDTRDRSVGYFGTDAGVGVALVAASEDPTVAALVAHDGRPDLVASRLSAVRAPTLLVVGAPDDELLAGNEAALQHLRCERALVVVPGAAGPGNHAIGHAVDWFLRNLDRPADTVPAILGGDPQ